MNGSKCDFCGMEMIRMRLVSSGTVYKCRNPKCRNYRKEVLR